MTATLSFGNSSKKARFGQPAETVESKPLIIMSSTLIKVGLVGCGNIAEKAYLPYTKEQQNSYEIVACCDVHTEAAKTLAEKFNIKRVHESAESLLADPEIDVVLNLTHPAGHASLNLQALEAGKHVYCEKPFALNLDEAKAVLETAEKRELTAGCAPDTVLGSGTQTTRATIEKGAIGEPKFGHIRMASPGHEHWHPNPSFYYQEGGGPLLDMGPYYLAALIHCLGPIRSVEGRAVKGFEQRTIVSQPLHGTQIPVECPTHYVGSIETESGVILQTLFSFDMMFGGEGGTCLPEFYGTEGAIRGTNPNRFDGLPVLNQQIRNYDFNEVEATHDYSCGRGIGLVDMVQAIREGREPRASARTAFHALEAMLAFHESEKTGQRIEIKSSCHKPPLMPFDGL